MRWGGKEALRSIDPNLMEPRLGRRLGLMKGPERVFRPAMLKEFKRRLNYRRCKSPRWSLCPKILKAKSGGVPGEAIPGVTHSIGRKKALNAFLGALAA
jgi:hypothetical protein